MVITTWDQFARAANEAATAPPNDERGPVVDTEKIARLGNMAREAWDIHSRIRDELNTDGVTDDEASALGHALGLAKQMAKKLDDARETAERGA